MQGYVDAFEVNMVPDDALAFRKLFQACVDGGQDCSDVVYIMRVLGQVRRLCARDGGQGEAC